MKNNSLWSDALYRLSRNRAAMFGGFILIMLIICAVLAPWLAPYSYSFQDLNLGASPPSSEHLLGTDILGRDLLSRILYGARISLLVGFVATGVALVIGVSWGIVAGYIGGRVDTIMMRIVDILYGQVLGITSLTYVVFIYIILRLYNSLRYMTVTQQMIVISFFILIKQHLFVWSNYVIGIDSEYFDLIISSLLSGILRPPMYFMLRFIRRKFQIS